MSAPATFTIHIARHTVARVILRSAWEATVGWPLVPRARLLVVATWLAGSFLATGREEAISPRAVLRAHGWVALPTVAGLVLWLASPLPEVATYVLGATTGALATAWAATRRPPPAWLFAVAAGAVVVFTLAGCHDTRPALATAAVQREVGATAAATLRTHCTERYETATTAAELDALDRVCQPAARALRAYRAAHALAVATLDGYESGRCATVASQASRECDVSGAVAAFVRASGELEEAIEAVRGEP